MERAKSASVQTKKRKKRKENEKHSGVFRLALQYGELDNLDSSHSLMFASKKENLSTTSLISKIKEESNIQIRHDLITNLLLYHSVRMTFHYIASQKEKLTGNDLRVFLLAAQVWLENHLIW